MSSASISEQAGLLAGDDDDGDGDGDGDGGAQVSPPPFGRLKSEQEPSWLTAAASSLETTINIAEMAQAGEAEARAQVRQAQATTKWVRGAGGAARAAAIDEAEQARQHAAQAQATTKWVRAGASAAVTTAHAEVERAQAALAGAVERLEQMQAEAGGRPDWLRGRGDRAAAFFGALHTVGGGLAQLCALSLDAWSEGLVELARNGAAGALLSTGAWAAHLYRIGVACTGGLEVCTCDAVAAELRLRGRGLLLCPLAALGYALLSAGALLCQAVLFLVALATACVRRHARGAPPPGV